MTFKQLSNELMEQGWRCYHIPSLGSANHATNLQALAIRNLLEVRVYEDKSLVFVKNTKPVEPEPKTKTNGRSN